MKIDPTKLTPGEIELINWQFGQNMGHFRDALWEAILKADNANLNLMAKGFPDQVNAYRRFSSVEGAWEELLKRSGLVPEAAPAANDGQEGDDDQSQH